MTYHGRVLARLQEGRKEVEERKAGEQLRQVQAWRREKKIVTNII